MSLPLPHLLSIARALLGPVVVVCLTLEWRGGVALALGLMLIAEATDFLDGWLARRLGQESDLGRLLDPVCDSIYHLSVYLAFLSEGWMPAWMLFAIYTRDLVVPYLVTFARQGGHDLGVRPSGKLKTCVHAAAQLGVVTLGLGLTQSPLTPEGLAGQALLVLATLASLWSLVDYARAAFSALRQEQA